MIAEATDSLICYCPDYFLKDSDDCFCRECSDAHTEDWPGAWRAVLAHFLLADDCYQALHSDFRAKPVVFFRMEQDEPDRVHLKVSHLFQQAGAVAHHF